MVSDATKTISRRILETTEKRILLAACFCWSVAHLVTVIMVSMQNRQNVKDYNGKLAAMSNIKN
jgi:hypothetical protein